MTSAAFELDGHSLITPQSIQNEILKIVNSTSDIDTIEAAWDRVKSQLDKLENDFSNGVNVAQIQHDITCFLHDVKFALTDDVWLTLVPRIQNHSIREFFFQDPITKWSWDKPRGYSGDAHLLDLIYKHPSIADDVAQATSIGKQLYEYSSATHAGTATVDRIGILARYVDMTAERVGSGAEVMSIAAGHLREVEQSVAYREGNLKRWVALDQDPESMALVAKNYPTGAVEAINGSVRDILGRRIDPGLYDHVYSSGLYDYLNDRVAIALTQRAVEFLKPGGTFLFANFGNEIREDGWMQTFMNWILVLRTEEDMKAIMEAATEGMDVTTEVFWGANNTIVYGVIKKNT
jgi:hypothetical protein